MGHLVRVVLRAASILPRFIAIALLAGCGSSGSLPVDAGDVDAASPVPPDDAGSASDQAAEGEGSADTRGHWDNLPSMPDPPRYYPGVAALGDSVFVIGGFVAPQTTVAQVFDTKTQVWQTLDPLPSPFAMPNVVAVGARLFILGGLQTQSVLEYDNQGHWTPRTQMPLANGRGDAAIGVWGTKVVIAGGVLPGQSANGLNTGVRMPDVVVYDTVADSWDTLAPLSEARGYAAGVVANDKFWVIGGSTTNARTAAVQVLDLVANRWTDGPPLDQSISSAAIAEVGDRSYLIGGIVSTSGIISPETLLFQRDVGSLVVLAPMLNPRFALGAAAVGNRIYVAGGIVMGSATDYHPVTTFDAFTP